MSRKRSSSSNTSAKPLLNDIKFSDEILTELKFGYNKITKIADHFQDSYVMDAHGQSVKASTILKKYMPDSINAVPNVSAGYLGQVNNLLINNTFMGWAELSLILQNPILNSVCSVKADEVTGKWIDFISTSETEDKEPKIKQLVEEFDRLNVKQIVNRAMYLSYGMGGCLLYPKITGDENEKERENPLVIADNLKIKDNLEYLQVIEPLYYVAINYVTDNPFSQWFYKPEKYVVLGMTIHESRICKFLVNEAPNLLKPTYLFNGIPLAQQMIPFVMNFETIRTEIVKIVKRFNTSVLKTNLLSILSDSSNAFTNGSKLANRIRGFIASASNTGVLALDKDSEEFVQIQINLSGLDKLQAQAAEFICLVARMPATKLFGTPAEGFNATGEHDLKNYYDSIRTDQEKIASPHITKLMHLAMLNIWGKIDKDINFVWNNLEEANELQESQIRLNLANEIAAYVDRDIITPQQAAERIANDENSGWDGLEILEADFENEEDGDDPEQINKKANAKSNKENEEIDA